MDAITEPNGLILMVTDTITELLTAPQKTEAFGVLFPEAWEGPAETIPDPVPTTTAGAPTASAATTMSAAPGAGTTMSMLKLKLKLKLKVKGKLRAWLKVANGQVNATAKVGGRRCRG